MRRRWYTLLTLCAAMFGLAALSSSNRQADPSSLGYRKVRLSDEETLSLLVDRIARGLESGDPPLYMKFIAEDYVEVPLGTLAAANVLPAGSAKGTVQRSITSRDQFRAVLANDPIRPFSSGSLRIRPEQTVASGSTGYSRLQPLVDDGPGGGVSLAFTKREGEWILCASDGLSRLAAMYSGGGTQTDVTSSLAGKGFAMPTGAAVASEDAGTFVPREVSHDFHISRLTREVTQEKLQRRLFSMPFGTALFARVQQFKAAPYFDAIYVQLVTDPAWDRIVYGDYGRWIKSYDGQETGTPLNRPHGIVVDLFGYVYVADTANHRVLRLRMTGAPGEIVLSHEGTIRNAGLIQPLDLAWDDQGTIFDASDDLLWVTDRGTAAVYAFRLAGPEGQPVTRYEGSGWLNPASVAIGRFNGRSDGNVYVADAGTRRVYRLFFDGRRLEEVGRYEGSAEMVPAAVETDHWGNVYLTDDAERQVVKLTAALEPLATLHPPDSDFRPLRFQPLFGSVQRAGAHEPDWSGYDQAFVLESWTQNSGGRRYQLGIDFALRTVELTRELSHISVEGKLTDAGRLRLVLEPARPSSPSTTIADAFVNAGEVDMTWDRHMKDGEMAEAGFYKLRATIQSTYDQPAIQKEIAEFYLPLFYHEDCGRSPVSDPHLTRGSRSGVFGDGGGFAVATDPQEVVYTFPGMNPAVSYEARASYLAREGLVEEALYADELPLHDPVMVGQEPVASDWMTIPATAVADGVLRLRIARTGGTGNASVADIWLREADYDPESPPPMAAQTGELPREFSLRQNYPNPFNPSTTIEFSVPQGFQGEVRLFIYNTLGQAVRELEKGRLNPGVYRKVWDGLDQSGLRAATGVYFYQLRAGEFTETRKLVLMK